ncbi:MAG: hypothetical protein AAF657_27140 [Acidobacteriota bacterium]
MARKNVSILIAVCAFVFLAQSARCDAPEVKPNVARLLDKAAAAIAEPELFDRLSSLQFKGRSWSTEAGSGEVFDSEPAKTEMLMVFPGEVPVELFMHSLHQPSTGGSFVRTLAGEFSFAKNIGHLPADLHQDFVRYASTKLLTILRYRKSPGFSAEWIGSEKIDGRDVDLVKASLFGHESTLEVERGSGRVLAVRFHSSEIQEGVEDQVVRRAYTDLRSVEGFTIPFLQEVTVGDEPYSRWQLDEVIVDGDYDTGLFDLRDE